jgi:hypothetical protein
VLQDFRGQRRVIGLTDQEESARNRSHDHSEIIVGLVSSVPLAGLADESQHGHLGDTAVPRSH